LAVKRLWLPLLVIAILLAIAVGGYRARQPEQAETVACADPVAGCPFEHGGVPAEVRFSAQPVPLEPFRLSVSAPGSTQVNVEFQMVGMDMGFNRYDLRREESGAFASRITLPVCVSGRRDWLMYVRIDDASYVVPFTSH
jgi:hypothetical protein